MLIGFWGVLGGQSRLRKCLGERESCLCTQIPQNSKVLMAQGRFNAELELRTCWNAPKSVPRAREETREGLVPQQCLHRLNKWLNKWLNKCCLCQPCLLSAHQCFPGTVLTSIHIYFPGHTPLHCAVLAHNTLLRDQGSQALTEEQHRELQQQSRELESCIHLLVQTGASIYSRVRTGSGTPGFLWEFSPIWCSKHRTGEGMSCWHKSQACSPSKGLLAELGAACWSSWSRHWTLTGSLEGRRCSPPAAELTWVSSDGFVGYLQVVLQNISYLAWVFYIFCSVFK